MSRLQLKATVRTTKGKNACRKLRAAGQIPAVFYTPEGKTASVQVRESELMRVYNATGRTAIFDLEINDNGKTTTCPCLVWDAEYYPTKQRFQHVDFYGVDMDKEVRVRVPLEFVGTPKGVKVGGKMDLYRDQIHIFCKPGDLVQKVMVDINKFDINTGLRIADLPLPQGVRASFDDNYPILFVAAPGGAPEEETKGGK